MCVKACETSSQLEHTANDWNGGNVQFPVEHDGFKSKEAAAAVFEFCTPKKVLNKWPHTFRLLVNLEAIHNRDRYHTQDKTVHVLVMPSRTRYVDRCGL